MLQDLQNISIYILYQNLQLSAKKPTQKLYGFWYHNVRLSGWLKDLFLCWQLSIPPDGSIVSTSVTVKYNSNSNFNSTGCQTSRSSRTSRTSKKQKPLGPKKVEFILYMTFLFCTPTMTGLKFASWESFVKTKAI